MTVRVVDDYFAAIRARDAGALGALFTDDAVLVSAAGTFHGPAEIAGFYRDLAFTIDDLWPEPCEQLVAGDRVAVEIRLTMGGATNLVADVFTLAGDRIERLVIYAGPPV